VKKIFTYQNNSLQRAIDKKSTNLLLCIILLTRYWVINSFYSVFYLYTDQNHNNSTIYGNSIISNSSK
jgi:hypothetical protein